MWAMCTHWHWQRDKSAIMNFRSKRPPWRCFKISVSKAQSSDTCPNLLLLLFHFTLCFWKMSNLFFSSYFYQAFLTMHHHQDITYIVASSTVSVVSWWSKLDAVSTLTHLTAMVASPEKKCDQDNSEWWKLRILGETLKANFPGKMTNYALNQNFSFFGIVILRICAEYLCCTLH